MTKYIYQESGRFYCRHESNKNYIFNAVTFPDEEIGSVIVPQITRAQNKKPNGCFLINKNSGQFDGLINWWDFSIAGTKSLYDKVGGSNFNSTWKIDPIRGHVISLNGTSDYAEINLPDTYLDENEATISVWVNRTGNGTDNETIYSRTNQFEFYLGEYGDVTS